MIVRISSALILIASISACAPQPVTIESLPDKPVEFKKQFNSKIDRDRAIIHYRKFLNLAPDSPMYPNALKRLAGLELENAEENFASNNSKVHQNAISQVERSIELHKTYLKIYPDAPGNDLLLYTLAKAYELKGDLENALSTLLKLAKSYPDSIYFEEANFRRGEILFTQQRYAESEKAFHAIGNRKLSPYKDKALYKYAWSLFKQNNYQAALIAFFKLLDSKQEYGLTNELEYPSHISRVEKEFLDDILRSISLTVSYMDGVNTLIQYLARHYAQQYEPLLFDRLATMYFTKKRYLDAANTYLAYSRSKPASLLAPDFHEKAIAIYQQAKFSTLVLNAKIDFIKQYGLDSHYWDIHEQSARNRLQPKLTRNIKEMATYYHSQMRQSQQQSDYDQAVYWYKFYIITFPNEQEASEINFMLAEIKAERKLYQEAIIEFEKTAYNYPAHSKSSEAAYAALLLYPQVIKTLPAKEAIQWQRKEIASDLNFADKFSFDSRATIVLANASEKLYDLREYSQAKQTVEKLIARFRPNTQTTLQQAAWIVHGHTNFETANYTDAEKSYTNALKFMTQKSTNRGAIEERLAASIYKQGEQALKEKQTEVASFHFLRIRNVTPTVDIRWTADYDAATILIHAEQWTQAQLLLEGLRQHYSSKEKIQLSISEKLAFIYAKTGHPYQAAKEMEKLASASTDPVYQRDILWQTAELYHNNKHPDDAARLYQNYVKDYPQQFDHTLEAQQFLAEYYTERKNTTESNKWYERIVKQDQNGGKQRTDRSRYLAAQASLILAAPLFREYQNAQLTIPLKKSLKIKKQLMQNTINAYQKVIDYNVIDVTTSATYSIAEIYNDFSRSLMQSQRPRNLKDEALEQYDILLEEQAYPFEEKAISIHQANLKNMANGVWDEWVQKSLDRLKKIQPVRYAKTERVEPYVSRMY